MLTDWPVKPLKEVARNASRPFRWSERPVIFVNTGDVLEGKFLHHTYTDKVGLPGQAKKAILPDDILLSEIRPGNGRYAFVESDTEDYVVSTKFMVIESGADVLPRYLYICLTSSRALATFQEIAESRSGTFPQVTFDAIGHFPIAVPAKPVQSFIIEAIGTLDDKIELNRSMNETLEGIARALFQSWFVDFDPVRAKADGSQPVGMDAETAALFPDSFQESKLGLIPTGWSLGAFGDIVIQHKQQVTPATEPEFLFLHHSIPAFDDGKRPIKEKGKGIGSNKFTVPEESVLISRLNPRIPRVWLIPNSEPKNRVCSTEFYVAIPRNGWNQTFVYSLAQSESFIESLQSMVTGTSGSHQRVRPGDMADLRVKMPPSGIVRHFEDIVGPLVKRVQIATDDSEALAQIRDTLLPRLISGELRVPDAEKLLAESSI